MRMSRTVARATTLGLLALGAAVAVGFSPARPDPPPVYPNEQCKFCTGFTQSGGSWVPSGTTGPVLVMEAYTDGAYTRRSALLRSEDVTLDGDGASEMWGQSTWEYIRGRWPIKRTKKITLASYGTRVIVQVQTPTNIPNVAEIHRVIVLWDGSPSTVKVCRWGVADTQTLLVTASDDEEYIEAIIDTSGGCTLGTPQPLSNAPQALKDFVAEVKTEAETNRNLHQPTF